MISPAAAEVSYAGAESTAVKDVDLRAVGEALAVAESDVRLFDRPDETDGRDGQWRCHGPDRSSAGSAHGCRRHCNPGD